MATKKVKTYNQNQLIIAVLVSLVVGTVGALFYQQAFAGTSAKELCHRAGGEWHKGIGCFVNGELVDV